MRLRHWISAVLGALVVGCAPAAPVDHAPLTFTRYQPIYMDVSSIDIVEEYKTPFKEPYVENLLPYSPAEAMRIWVKDRLRAVGGDRTLQVIIKQGSVIEVPVNPSGVDKFIPLNRDTRYDARLAVEMRVYGPQSAISESNVTVEATRSITIPERASADRRDTLFRQMIADLMETANAELERNMFLYMANSISFSHSP